MYFLLHIYQMPKYDVKITGTHTPQFSTLSYKDQAIWDIIVATGE